MAISGKTATPHEIPYVFGSDTPPDMAALSKAVAERVHGQLDAIAPKQITGVAKKQLLIANASGVVQPVTASGDITNDESGKFTLAAAVKQAMFSPGDLKATAVPSAPEGWLLCEGQSLLRAGTYAALFAAISTTYGTADGTHFNVPDLRGRTAVGVDGGAARLSANDALGKSGGEEKHTLTEAEMPPHVHGIDVQNFEHWTATGPQETTVHVPSGLNTHSTGGGVSHNNMQPYQIVNYLIKI